MVPDGRRQSAYVAYGLRFFQFGQELLPQALIAAACTAQLTKKASVGRTAQTHVLKALAESQSYKAQLCPSRLAPQPPPLLPLPRLFHFDPPASRPQVPAQDTRTATATTRQLNPTTQLNTNTIAQSTTRRIIPTCFYFASTTVALAPILDTFELPRLSLFQLLQP